MLCVIKLAMDGLGIDTSVLDSEYGVNEHWRRLTRKSKHGREEKAGGTHFMRRPSRFDRNADKSPIGHLPIVQFFL